jgi:hypothetical protein
MMTVLTRRSGRKVARGTLLPRVDSLTYADVTLGIVGGPYNKETGIPAGSAAFPMTDPDRLITALDDLGVDVREFWDTDEFVTALHCDLLDWARYVRRLAHTDTLRYALNAVVSLAALRQDPVLAKRVAHEIEPNRSIGDLASSAHLELERDRLSAEVRELRSSLSLRLGRTLLSPAIRAKQWYNRHVG